MKLKNLWKKYCQNQTISRKVDTIVKETLSVDKVRDEDRFIEDLGADELDTVEILIDIEYTFKITDDYDDRWDKVYTVGEAKKFVKDILDLPRRGRLNESQKKAV